MKSLKIYDGSHQWIMFGRDQHKQKGVIDTNQYMIKSGGKCLLIDPGGIELFAPMLSAILHHAGIDEITDLFASHQDPDIISSLGLWDQTLPGAKLHASSLWEGFLRHFGCSAIEYVSISDRGGIISLSGLELQVIPAHYLHSSANFNIYDPKAKILFSGDIGSALGASDASFFVEDFDAHTEQMRYFHQRWMPSNAAKRDWIERVRRLEIDMMVPQHGHIFKGHDVKLFLDWFDRLNVGIAI